VRAVALGLGRKSPGSTESSSLQGSCVRGSEEADYDRRLGPVKRSVESCGLMTEKRELDYRHRLVDQIFSSLHVAQPEAPLPSGTKVDAYMEFGEDWYITVKRGLNPGETQSQQR
jgi:hypothetical protein